MLPTTPACVRIPRRGRPTARTRPQFTPPTPARHTVINSLPDSPSLRSRPQTADDSAQRVIAASLAVLSQGESFLAGIPEESYRRRHPIAFNASIGGHYRHCLDHFVSLLRSLDTGVVDYDARDRNPDIETRPEIALAATRSLRAALEQLSIEVIHADVPIRCSVSYDESGAPVFPSSVGRELTYAITHAIHHFALIAFLARLQSVPIPENFGIAPSTVAFQRTPTPSS